MAKKSAGKASNENTSNPTNPTVRTPINMGSDPEPLYNTFTKSYPNRHIVHGAREGDIKTLCGRNIVSMSDAPYLTEAPGSCLKCRKKIEVETRTHPGWVDE